jgi:hypothetical protein
MVIFPINSNPWFILQYLDKDEIKKLAKMTGTRVSNKDMFTKPNTRAASNGRNTVSTDLPGSPGGGA